MSESEHLAEALIGLLLEEENGWFLPALSALKGLSAEQAAKSPGEKFNSPWSILRHMTYWMEFIMCRLLGEDPRAKLGEDWGDIYDPLSEVAWEGDKTHLAEVTRRMADTVRGWDDILLEQPYIEGGSKRRQVIQGVIGHNCYHTNEIICSRHMLGFWLEQT